jgi:hypothetical protein
MRLTIQLDNQSSFRAVKIDDVWTDKYVVVETSYPGVRGVEDVSRVQLPLAVFRSSRRVAFFSVRLWIR